MLHYGQLLRGVNPGFGWLATTEEIVILDSFEDTAGTGSRCIVDRLDISQVS